MKQQNKLNMPDCSLYAVLIRVTRAAGMDLHSYMRSKAKLAEGTDLLAAGRETVAREDTAERDWLLGLPDKVRQGLVENKTNLVRGLAVAR